MSLTELPDVALIQIFRTLDHIELVRLYHSFNSSKRIQTLIHNCSCLWTHIHIKSTVDYNLFTYFSRLLISNASTTRQLIIDELDLTCRKILYDNEFSIKKFSCLEQLIIHDEYISNTLQSLKFCSSTLKLLRLTNDHTNLNNLNQLNQLNILQITLYSGNIFQNKFQQLTNLHLKIMFDYDHNSQNIFSNLPNEYLQTFTLKFLLLNNDFNFHTEFDNYLNSCYYLHTLELSYLHGMCPLSIYTNLNYSKYQRISFLNICQLKQMKTFLELNHCILPLEYFQLNSTLHSNQYSSKIQNVHWYTKELISIDYIQCVTTSMEFLNEYNIIWSDKSQTQSFESYILRSFYHLPHLITSIKNLSINKFELSLNGLIILMTNLSLVNQLYISDGKIDQMGSGMWDIEKILNTISNRNQSNIENIFMNNIQMSCRTIVQFCLITQKLLSLTMNDVRMIASEQNKYCTRPDLLVILKQIAQYTDQFKWSQLKTLTLGKHLINRDNLFSYIPSNLNTNYSINLEHLCLIIHDQTLLNPHDIFLKSMKKLVKLYPKLTSFIIEFPKRYEGCFRLRNQLHTLFESHINKKILVYPTINDYACRFCFDTNFNCDDDDENSSSQNTRTFCGIPLFQFNKQQRKSNFFS